MLYKKQSVVIAACSSVFVTSEVSDLDLGADLNTDSSSLFTAVGLCSVDRVARVKVMLLRHCIADILVNSPIEKPFNLC